MCKIENKNGVIHSNLVYPKIHARHINHQRSGYMLAGTGTADADVPVGLPGDCSPSDCSPSGKLKGHNRANSLEHSWAWLQIWHSVHAAETARKRQLWGQYEKGCLRYMFQRPCLCCAVETGVLPTPFSSACRCCSGDFQTDV